MLGSARTYDMGQFAILRTNCTALMTYPVQIHAHVVGSRVDVVMLPAMVRNKAGNKNQGA